MSIFCFQPMKVFQAFVVSYNSFLLLQRYDKRYGNSPQDKQMLDSFILSAFHCSRVSMSSEIFIQIWFLVVMIRSGLSGWFN